jgi:hypothetical protein
MHLIFFHKIGCDIHYGGGARDVKTGSSPLRTRTNDVDSLAAIVKLEKLIMRLKLTFLVIKNS